MDLGESLYDRAKDEAEHLYARTDPVKASVLLGSTATALYAASDPTSPDWVNTAGHMATGSFGASLTDLCYDWLEPEDERVEKVRKPLIFGAGLATGNAGQLTQEFTDLSGGYKFTSVAEAGMAAAAYALGSEENGSD